ncbi:hypothetical protein IF650_16400 [Cellulosimicrobium terreum]|nr:hypothetical protein [Cellulosimicrobium terreum]
MHPPRRTAALPVLVALSVVLAGCTPGTGTDPEEPAPSTSTSPPATQSPDEEASAEETQDDASEEAAEDPLADRPTQAPDQQVAAGTVAEGAAAEASGEGSAEVTFERDGDFAVVVHLDCGDCAGTRAFMAPTDVTPYPGTLAESSGAYLMDVFEDSAPEQSVWLETDGAWSLRFESWNDLPVTTGAQSGTGSTVLLIDGGTPEAEVTWAPAGEGDTFQGRFFGVDRAAARMFGDSVAFTDVFEMPLPGVLAITTDGEWSVTPQG